MENLWRDLQYGLRNLLRSPAFTAAAILALGIGIGSVTAIFSILDDIMLRPLPFKDPSRLVMLWETNSPQSLDHEPISPVNFVDYRSLSHTFSDATAWWNPDFTLTDDTNEPVHVNAIETLSNFFSVLGVEPALGRAFSTEALFVPGAAEIVLSHRLWESRFHSDPTLVGRSIRLNGRPFTVIGVMGVGFNFPGSTDIWQLQVWDPSQHVRTAHFMESAARLAPGVSLAQAQAELTALTGRLQTEFASSNKDWGARPVPLLHEVLGYFRPALYVLMAAVTLLLLIACINVANLLLARAAAREREVAIRSAIGASRKRLVQQFLTESLLLSCGGAVLGLILAIVGVRALSLSPSIPIPRLDQIVVDGRILLFAILVAGITPVLFGLLPSTLMSRGNAQAVLKEGSRGTGSLTRARVRQLLVVSEVGLAVMVLIGAGLLIRTVQRLASEKAGFSADRVITASIQAPSSGYTTFAQVERFYAQVLAALRERHAITAVGMSNVLPLSNGWRIPFRLPGDSPSPADLQRMVQYQSVSDGYFQAIGVPVLRGRDFDERDTAENPGVVIVNEAFVRRYFPTEDPIGKNIFSVPTNIGPLGLSLMHDRTHRIIGVVGDVKNQTLRGTIEPAIFQSSRQFPFRTMNLVIRSSGDPMAVTANLREAIKQLDPSIAVSDVHPLGRVIEHEVEQPKLLMSLLSGFAVIAVALASLGSYSVLSYSVTQRQRELSIRLALGAKPASLRRLVVWQGLRMTALGMLFGLLGAEVLGRYLVTVLYGVKLGDLSTTAGVLVTILAVALVACFVPARRASSIDPLDGLRAE